MEDVQWRDEIENLYGLRVCAIIQLVFGVMSLVGALTNKRNANDENALPGPQGAKAQAAQQSSNSSSFVIGLTTGILGVVSLYVEDQSKGLFHAYQAWIAFCIIGLIPVVFVLVLTVVGGLAACACACKEGGGAGGIAALCGCLCVLIGIGLGMAVNIAILVMGWPYAFGDNQAHPNLG